MVRNRILAALFALPLAACAVEDSSEALTENTDGVGSLSSADVKSALSAIPGALVLGKHEDGVVPYFVRGDFGSAGQSLRGLAARDASARVGDALHRIAPVFRLQPNDLVVKRISVDEQGHSHIRYAQTKNGLEVVGGELVVHVDQDGSIYAANGSARDGEAAPALARVSDEAARAAALENTLGRRLATEGEARLVYIRSEKDSRLKLAYHVVVTGEGTDLPIRDNVYVNALTGQVEATHSEIHSAKNRAVYSANNGTSLPGTLKRSEGGAATGDTHVDENYNHLGTTYDCYSVNFGRDSYNGAGAQLRSTVHYSTSYTNAFWNGTQMVYGDSNGVDAAPLGKSLDVTVHELTHAVTSSESNLTYANESGALNEGLSDIFGAYCESWSRGWTVDAAVWMVGDDVWTPATPGDALRYMANPTQDGSSKDYYPTRYTGSSDNGGVHWNSGIANLAFVLLTQGGTHPRAVTTTNVTGIGIQKAGAVFYKANVDYMTASTTFAQAKTYTEQAATALGYTTAEVASVSDAWTAVGVGGGTTPPPTCTTPVALSNGVTVTGISASASSWSCTYTLAVPAGSTNLAFNLSGGTGDGDMYVKFGSEPTSSSYDCRPYLGGNAETCTFAAPSAGTYYVKIYGYSAASGMSLNGSYTAGSGGGGPVTETASGSVTAGENDYFGGFSVVPGTQFKVVMTGSGDPDLYVRFGAQPTTTTYNCRPYLSGASETCDVAVPAGQSSAYILVRGYTAGSYNLTINYTKP
ncbi:M4 family metallopeptidase [Archangium lansingense]|uniref:M4 family metallopeptidase n=1 Tax=Archangium lansingense TaxID=2995310 RepID=A0ABT4AJV6_9BACT|nr:M4 family metallopeptidase [Archangium lansinium]MCY1081976.1 M4 family metallopeptidase [Archangium lansinium]